MTEYQGHIIIFLDEIVNCACPARLIHTKLIYNPFMVDQKRKIWKKLLDRNIERNEYFKLF